MASEAVMVELVRLLTRVLEVAEAITSEGSSGSCGEDCPYRTWRELERIGPLPPATAPGVVTNDAPGPAGGRGAS